MSRLINGQGSSLLTTSGTEYKFSRWERLGRHEAEIWRRIGTMLVDVEGEPSDRVTHITEPAREGMSSDGVSSP